jgi:putative FmdB family regulatory protein
MPIYEFLCERCGPFDLWRSFDEAGAAQTCPVCRSVAKRVYSAPGFARTPPALASARDRAEKSAYEPEVIAQSRPGTEPIGRQVRHQTHGAPWMLGE